MARIPSSLLAVFLEKDNTKLVVYRRSGKKVERVFAGQISFTEAVLRDAFIADPPKFAAQIGIAFAQKPPLNEASEVLLFVPPDKTFTKTIPATDSVESFIRSLPYFKEELLIFPDEIKIKEKKPTSDITYVAFERRLVEDFERPFLTAGKKITAVVSSINIAAEAFAQTGQYFLLVPSEKDITVAAVTNGGITEVAHYPKDVFAGRFGEFIATHNLFEVKRAFTLGIIDEAILAKIRTERGVTIEHLGQSDIYDLLTNAALSLSSRGGLHSLLLGVSFPKFNFTAKALPLQKIFLLVGALLLGFGLVFILIKTFSGQTTTSTSQTVVKKTVEPVAKPVAPEPKPGDFSVTVLNGTRVTGEAGRLAETLKAEGFNIVETKNASNSAFVTTKLLVTSGVPEQIINRLKETISQTYEVVEVETQSGSDNKIEVIIGKKKS